MPAPLRRRPVLRLAVLTAALTGATALQAQPLAPAPAAPIAPEVPPAQAKEGPVAPEEPLPMTEEAFAAALASEDLPALELACQDSARFDLPQRLRLLRDRLVELRPAPQPLRVVLANANALISCRSPEAALSVLDRFGPGPGLERQQWLIQQWRAANAGLNHRRASEALRRLADGNLATLETMPLPQRLRDDGTLDTRPALDVLAGHLAVLGRNGEAAQVLLSGRLPGQVAAERLQLAVALLTTLPLAERNTLLETALDQAAADGAWGMAAELLDTQSALQRTAGGDPAAAEQRRLRLSQRIDDAYAEWQLRRQDPAQAPRAAELEKELRSPRSPGGHTPAPTVPAPATPQP